MTATGSDREGFAAFMLRMRARALDNKALFVAMEETQRAGFLPSEWHAAAWSPRMAPLACGEAMEGCDLQAVVLDALSLSADNRVLEIGTGSGFTAAVMARLSARVLSLDRYRTLTEEAAQRWETLGIDNATARHGDGSEGAPADGPFDRIVCWAAFDEPPRRFVDQLATGGIMVAPIGPADGPQTMARLAKVGSRFERTDIEQVRLQPLMTGTAEAI